MVFIECVKPCSPHPLPARALDASRRRFAPTPAQLPLPMQCAPPDFAQLLSSTSQMSACKNRGGQMSHGGSRGDVLHSGTH